MYGLVMDGIDIKRNMRIGDRWMEGIDIRRNMWVGADVDRCMEEYVDW